MRFVIAQVNPTVGALSRNAALVREGVLLARRCGADLIAFPEMMISGYPPEDLLLKEHFVRDCEEIAGELAEEVTGVVAVVGCPLLSGGLVYNGALVMGGGKIIARYHKIRLPNYAVFDEGRYFASGDRVLVLTTPEGRVAVNVCEDIWEVGGPTEEAAVRGGAQAVVNISMSPYHFGKGRDREAMLSRRAADAGAFVLYANGVGGQDELVFDGHSLVFGPDGTLLTRGPQFEEDLMVLDLDLAKGGTAPPRVESPGLWPVEEFPVPAEVLHQDEARVTDPVVLDERRLPDPRVVPDAPGRPFEPLAELYHALVLGVGDYVRKNGLDHVVLGLSGGIDSALTACIAFDALGAEGVTGVSMPSRYTSTGTRSDAAVLADALGIGFEEIPIEAMFQSYLEALEGQFEGLAPNVAEENIQARIRGNLLMALSNKFGWLVLTTGNKSEMAVGYATLYGDMAGGFAAIKDVPKTMVYELSRFRNDLHEGEGPIPASVIERAPSAELAFGQVDQDSLPPYEVLDRIVEEYVVRDRSIEQIVAGGLPLDVVGRVVGMIDRNEYKRRQGPPGPRLTSKAFGKDRRLPITNRYRG